MSRTTAVVPMLTISEKARELQVSAETLRRWRKAGEGPKFVKYGGEIRYFPEREDAE